MPRNLSTGSTGRDVSDVQRSLNARDPTALPRLKVDGIFGPKTVARVKEFQRNNGLVADGIVGPNTFAALVGNDRRSRDRGCDCCNGEQPAAARALAGALLASRAPATSTLAFASAPGASALAGAPAAALTGSGPIRMLTPTQVAKARTVYGSSLDFSTIFISDKTGVGNRPFTMAFPDQGQIVQIINCGTFTPKDDTLIHELAHVWQSQHHSDKFRFMVNAVDSQAGAVVASAAAATDDPFVMLNKDFPAFFPFDAYAYSPGLPFASLAAEQMASAVENGEAAIVAHVRGVPMNAVDSQLVTALSNPGFADRRLSFVK